MNRSLFDKIIMTGLFAAVLFLAMPSASAQDTAGGITLDMSGVSLEEVMDAIEAQSQYLFLNDGADIGHAVSIKVKDADIESVLSSLFDGTDINWGITGTSIYISRRHSSPADTSGAEDGTIIGMTGVGCRSNVAAYYGK